jgi:hypothetical protein
VKNKEMSLNLRNDCNCLNKYFYWFSWQDIILMCWTKNPPTSILSFYIIFLSFLLDQKGTKKPRLYKVLMIFYVRFLPRHASRSPSKSKPLLNFVTWLTSAWLAYALRSKTFLEKLLTLY